MKRGSKQNMVYGNQNPYYGQQWYQPQMPLTNVGQQQFVPQQQLFQQSNSQQQENSFIWVQGKEAAKAYLVAPGKDILLMDSENPYIYMKSTDINGKPQKMKTYRLVEEFDEEEVEIKSEDVPTEEYVSKVEFDTLLKEIEELKSYIKEDSEPPKTTTTKGRRTAK